MRTVVEHEGTTCIVMAKWPRPGHVKTRIAAEIGDSGAATLAEAMLLDTIERVKESGMVWALCLDPGEEALPAVARDYPVRLQRGDGLGARVTAAVEEQWEEGARCVVVLGTDSPNFPDFHLLNAAYHLGAGAPSVLGPTLDGGLYLLGFRKPAEQEETVGRLADVLTDLPWETERVCAEASARLVPPWGPPLILDVWYDIDTTEDLARLSRDLKDPASGGRYCPKTKQWLERAEF